MDKKLAGLSGAAAALTTKTAAKAAPATDEATKGISSDAPFSHAVAPWRAEAKFADARLPGRLFLLEAVKKRGAAKPDFSPKRPSRPKPSPTPSRTTTNPDGMFHKLRSRLQLRPTWPKPF